MAKRFIPETLESDEQARALLLVRMSFAGIAIWLSMLVYHSLTGVPLWALGIETGLLALTASVPLSLWRSGSVRGAAWLLCLVGFVGVALMSLLNGGFPFHVLIFGLLIPVSVPATWPVLFRLSVIGCVVLYVVLFALALLGLSPEATVQHSELGRLVVEGIALIAVFFFLILISRSSSGVTYAHVREREGYQRALLQSQKLSSLGQLADSLVHDFNNILMSMDYALYLLSESVRADDPRGEEVGHLVQAMDRAKGLASRLESFGGDGDACPTIDLDDTVSNLVEVARRLTDIDTPVEFSLASGVMVDIDPTQLDQIVVNLLVNANDAIGGVGTIRVTTSAQKDVVTLEVSDTGGGVPVDVRESLFEPFFTTKGPGAGTGLGLWSSRTTAREAGGDLTFETELGVGTTMRLVLPVSGNQPERLASAEVEPKAPAATPSISSNRGQQGRLIRWATETINEPRGRLWGAALVMLSFSGVALWLGFAAWYLLDFNEVGVALAMSSAAVLHLLVPPLLRITRSVYVVIVALGVLELAGLAIPIIARGGFPLPVLIFLLVIPLVVNLQKEFRSLVPLSIGACLAYIGTFFVLAVVNGREPTSIVLTETQALAESFIVLGCALALFCMAIRVGQRVDAELVEERDRFRLALLQSQKRETLGTFASSIAHDLNNVLMSLEFSTTLLDEATPGDHRGRVDIDELRNACSRIRSLSRRLVCFGRNDDGDTSSVRLDAALTSLESMVRPLLGRHIELAFDLSAKAARIDMPSKRFEQIVLNLLLNARDAMPDGGAIRLSTEATENGVRIDIKDSGTGIPDDIAGLIFDPFFTAEGSDRAGLGLWIGRGLAEEAGGSLTLTESTDMGTTMTIRLPRATGQQPHEFSELIRRPSAGSFRSANA